MKMWNGKTTWKKVERSHQRMEIMNPGPVFFPGVLKMVSPGILKRITQGILEMVSPGILERITQGMLEMVSPGMPERITQGMLEMVSPGMPERDRMRDL